MAAVPVCVATWVLIQHNPNEGLKLGLHGLAPFGHEGAHSAQPERGIETITSHAVPLSGVVLIQHNPNEGLKPLNRALGVFDCAVLIQHNPNEGLKLPSP